MEKYSFDALEYTTACFMWLAEPERTDNRSGRLEEALSLVCQSSIKVRERAELTRGVHALAQCCVISRRILDLQTESHWCCMKQYAQVGDTVLAVRSVRLEFYQQKKNLKIFMHMRFDCKGKENYIYRGYAIGGGDVFEPVYCYFVDEKLDVDAMNEDLQVSSWNSWFAAFQSAGEITRTWVRTISSAKVSRINMRLWAAQVRIGDLWWWISL